MFCSKRYITVLQLLLLNDTVVVLLLVVKTYFLSRSTGHFQKDNFTLSDGNIAGEAIKNFHLLSAKLLHCGLM